MMENIENQEMSKTEQTEAVEVQRETAEDLASPEDIERLAKQADAEIGELQIFGQETVEQIAQEAGVSVDEVTKGQLAEISAEAVQVGTELKQELGEVSKENSGIVEKQKEPEIELTPEQQAAKEELIRNLSTGDIGVVFTILEKAILSEEILHTSEIQQAAEERAAYSLRIRGEDQELGRDIALQIKDKFGLSEEMFQRAVKKGLGHIIETGNRDDVAKMAENFSLSEEIIQQTAKEQIVESFEFGDLNTAFDISETFQISLELMQDLGRQGLRTALEQGDIKIAILLNQKFKIGDKLLVKLFKDFGEFANLELYDTYKALEGGQVPKSLKLFEIKKAGQTGINELRRKLREMQAEMISGELDEELLQSPIVQSWLMSITGYQSAEWGTHDSGSFKSVMETYLENKDEIRPLSEEYKPSHILRISKIDKEKQAEFKYSGEFLSRYQSVLDSIKEARQLYDKESGLEELVGRLTQTRDAVLTRLEKQILEKQSASMPEQAREKALAALAQQKEILSSLDLKNLTAEQGPKEIFDVLSSFREFNNDLRTMVFYGSFQVNEMSRRENLSSYSSDNPSLEEISWVSNFSDHITNQETFSQYFTDKEAAKKFSSLLNVSALEQEMSRMQNQDTKGTMALKFVPSRDLLTEMSGHIADACWASKYKSILKEFPNFISLTMVQNPGKEKDERLSGSAILIETTSIDDEPLLVVRGLNPKENLINQLDVQDYYKQLISYLKPIAEKTGRKLAIVIDDHSGGAATNRPVLFRMLAELKEGLKPVKLKSKEDTEFNGYDIRENTFLVD